jgi:creatinine amidohydrolase
VIRLDFDTLTWPEVASLPRQTPLVLPLGNGFSLDALGKALGGPDVVYLLPAIPYGWQGSGLDVDSALFSQMVSNLLGGMRQDGFERLFVLAPPGVSLESGLNCIHQEQAEPSIPVAGHVDPARVMLIPIGHTEQHGYHLPLSTDTLIIDAISRGTAAAVPQQAVSLPVMPYGVSMHRRSFAGTFNTGGRTFEDFHLAVIDRLVGRGCRMLYLLSGHGGNGSFLTNVVKYAGERHTGIFCATAWLYLSGPRGVEALERYRRSAPGGMGHACELETALIQHLRPDLVHIDRVVDETGFISTPSYSMDWLESGALIANPPWEDDTRTGAYGAGSLATPEHGRLWLEAAIAEKVDHVAEIVEQYRRRRGDRGCLSLDASS